MKKIYFLLIIIISFLYTQNSIAEKYIFKKFYSNEKKNLLYKNNKIKNIIVTFYKVNLTPKNIYSFFYIKNFEPLKNFSKDLKKLKVYSPTGNFYIPLKSLTPGLYIIKIDSTDLKKYYKLLITEGRLLYKKYNNKINPYFINIKTGKPLKKYTILNNNNLFKIKNYTTSLSLNSTYQKLISFKSNYIDFLNINYNPISITNNDISLILEKKDIPIGEFLNALIILRKRINNTITVPFLSSIILKIKDKYGLLIYQKSIKDINNGLYRFSLPIDDKFKEGNYKIIVNWNEKKIIKDINIYENRENEYLFFFKKSKNICFFNDKIRINVTILQKFGAFLKKGILKCDIFAKQVNEKNFNFIRTITTSVNDGKAIIKFKPDFLKKENYILKLIFKVRSNNGYIEGDYISFPLLNSSYNLTIENKKNIYELNETIKIKYKIKKLYNYKLKKFVISLYRVKNIEKKDKKILILKKNLSPDSLSGVFKYKLNKKGLFKIIFVLVDSKGNVIKKENFFWVVSYIYGINIKNIKNIKIIPNKNSYSYSDIGKILILLPEKNMWVNIALERDKIFKETFIFAEENFIMYDFPIDEKYSPDIYATVFSIKNNRLFYTSVPINVPTVSKILKFNYSISNLISLPEKQNKIKIKVLNYWNHPVNSFLNIFTLLKNYINFYNYKIPDIFSKWYSFRKNNISFYPTKEKNKKNKISKKNKKILVYSPYLKDSSINYNFTEVEKDKEFNYSFKYNKIRGDWETFIIGINNDSKFGISSVSHFVKNSFNISYYYPKYLFIGDSFYLSAIAKNFLPIKKKVKLNLFIVNGKYGKSLSQNFYIPSYWYNYIFFKIRPYVDKTLKINISAFLPEKIERKSLYINILKKIHFTPEKNKFLKIRKKYYYLKYRENNSYYSKPSSTGTSFDFGDDILVEIRIKSKKKFTNLKIIDYIPAGCEYINNNRFHLIKINPNLNYGTFLKNEKITFYVTSINKGEYYIYYLLKAKIKGEFQVPPIKIFNKNKLIYCGKKIRYIKIK